MKVYRWIGLSLLIHIILIALVAMINPSVKNQVVKVRKEKNNFIELQENKSLPIVDQPVTEKVNRIPRKATVSSDHNQVVQKETVRRKTPRSIDLNIHHEEYLNGNMAVNQKPTKQSPHSSETDDVRDVPEGEETVLNSRELMYFSFYQRAKEKLEAYWRPDVRATVYNMLAKKDPALINKRVTKLLIYLDSTGHLTKVQMLEDSGVVDLDQIAVNAFKRAEPFPNPPKALIESDGLVKIRWDFIVER